MDLRKIRTGVRSARTARIGRLSAINIIPLICGGDKRAALAVERIAAMLDGAV